MNYKLSEGAEKPKTEQFVFLLLNFDMEKYSYRLTKEGFVGLLIILAGSYFFGFLGFCISIVVSIGIIILLGD